MQKIKSKNIYLSLSLFYKALSKSWVFPSILLHIFFLFVFFQTIAMSGILLFMPAKLLEKWHQDPLLITSLLFLSLLFFIYCLCCFSKSFSSKYNIGIFTDPIKKNIEMYSQKKSYEIECEALKAGITLNTRKQKASIL